jgi:hypothetical protein
MLRGGRRALRAARGLDRGLPLAMPLCPPDCTRPASWTFKGNQGVSVWAGGVIAKLTVERFDNGGVVVRHADIAVVSRGVQALCTGLINGNVVEGSMSWAAPGMQPVTQAWTGKLVAPDKQQAIVQRQMRAIAARGPATDFIVVAGPAVCRGEPASARDPRVRAALFSLGMLTLAIFAFVSRKVVLARVDALNRSIGAGNALAIARFREVHITVMAVNVVLFVVAISRLSF